MSARRGRELCAGPPCLTMGTVRDGAALARPSARAPVFAVSARVVDDRRRTLDDRGRLFRPAIPLVADTASPRGYRGHFGTTWTWWAPFAELLWHPVTTPALLLAGLAGCLGLDRLARQGRPGPAA